MQFRIRQKHGVPLLSLVLAIALTGSLVVGGPAQAREKAPSPESTALLGKISDALADVAESARPSVVNISTTSTVTMEENPHGDFFDDPFFRRFFGDQFGQGQGPGRKRSFKSQALGSGVIVSENGYILTNNHVVKDADEIKVILYDKREFAGKIVGTDPKTDLAVVKINAKDLPVMRIGDSSKLKTGDIVLAIGNPFGLNQTITMGIVSAVGRSNVGIADFEDFIQTDAAINPGNSGGALVNSSGQLVGINTAIFSTSGGYMGIGFAIPADMAKSVMDSIIKHGKVIRGWLGVSIQNLTPDLAKSFGLKEEKGALIAGVEKDSPADKGGLKRGDFVIALNGKPVEDVTTLRNMIAGTEPGKSVTLTVIRDQKQQTLTITLGELKERKMPAKKVDYDNALKGLTVQELSASLRDQAGLPEDLKGVMITGMAPDSPAQGILQPRDVIMQVDQAEIKSLADYEKVASKIKKHDTVLLLIYRGGASIYITIKE